MGAYAHLQKLLTVSGTVGAGQTAILLPWEVDGVELEDALVDALGHRAGIFTIHVLNASTASSGDEVLLHVATVGSRESTRFPSGQSGPSALSGPLWNVCDFEVVGDAETEVAHRWLKCSRVLRTADDSAMVDHPIDRYLYWVIEVSGAAGGGGPWSATFRLDVVLKGRG